MSKPSKQVAKNYAQALIELAGSDLKLQEEFLNEITVICESINKVKGAKETFETPTISKEEKKALIKKLFERKINQKTFNFLLLLTDKQRLSILPEIQKQLTIVVNKNKGITIAEVSSASQLDSTSLEALKQKLEKVLGNNEKVTIESKVEPALIGGIVVKVNDLVYDGSVKGRLENLKRRLG